ncbi:MAG: PAM68 family protein [Pseudanabaenaceae cyanobacterium bins.39]|nr:PAM68 family protein [Pseudanabaenaceae cyanobacterium bins.39]
MTREDRIPFEPNSKHKSNKKVNKGASGKAAPTSVKSTKADEKPITKNIAQGSTHGSKVKSNSGNSLGIPDEVNRRIVRRAALFCGIPTALGLSTFIISYFLVSKHIIDLPTSAVVLLSMLFLGLGVVGLSYGAISASWDVGRLGTWWGSEEFKKNFGYLKEAWKSQQQLAKSKSTNS